MTGPRPAPAPITEPCTPNARPRSEGVVIARSSDWTLGDKPDANAACAARMATSTGNVGANIAAAEHSPKPLTAMMPSRRAPMASARRPDSG